MAAHQVFTFDEPTDVYVSNTGGRLRVILKSQGDTVELDVNVNEINFMEEQDGTPPASERIAVARG